MAKYVFVTGGVVSGVGKGVTVASLGRLMKSRGLSVAVVKVDPYLNVDPGTMNPYQHGECFVTEDGAETDLDLGHYERFIDENLSKASNVTTGQVYSSIINRERRGDFLGGTIQVIPHITNEIKQRIAKVAKQTGAQLVIAEIGGVVGDIEGLPFLEAIRQMHRELGSDNVLYIHTTWLPYIGATGELKTKPTQHSVNELRRIGIQPDVIVCRSDHPMSDDLKDKIALFCDVERRAVIPLPTVETVYEVPLILENANLGNFVVEHLQLPAGEPQLDEWQIMVNKIKQPKPELRIGLVGKYVELADAYLSVREALHHAGIYYDRAIVIDLIDSDSLLHEGNEDRLSCVNGIVIPGGFGYRGIEGKIRAARYARRMKIPYLGLCLGMQVMVIDLAREVFRSDAPNSTEFDPNTPCPVIDLLPEQRAMSMKGGTMRLGAYPCRLIPGTKAAAAYDQPLVQERHRHRYEFNNEYRDILVAAGLVVSGVSPDERLVEIAEIADHPWMVGTQFHPEFKSRPNRPHPLFRDFIGAAMQTLREGDQQPLPLEQALI
ncbi:MAG: CTP synthase [Chloroflexi bacterium]|nr:CTP synthase [Chloroflexota bacterium]MCL5076253.1 CTP synthase [Chloroflexota bacterium]